MQEAGEWRKNIAKHRIFLGTACVHHKEWKAIDVD